jgi:hypothetical protein
MSMPVDLETIWELQQDMNAKLDEAIEFKAAHVEHHKQQDLIVRRTEKALFANPAGLTYQVAAMAQNGRADKTNRQYWRAFWFGLMRTLATAAIIGVVIWMLSIYKSSPGG